MCALCSTNKFISRIAGIAGCRSRVQGTSREGQHCTAIHTNHKDFTALNFYQMKKYQFAFPSSEKDCKSGAGENAI